MHQYLSSLQYNGTTDIHTTNEYYQECSESENENDNSRVHFTTKIIHPDLTESIISVIQNAISTKMREEGVINKEFTNVHDLLLTTNVGSEFVYQLPMINIPTFQPHASLSLTS